MAKNALCIGINDYPGTRNDLAGCINDADDWSTLLTGRGFTVKNLRDAQATKAGMVSAIGELLGRAQAGDSLIMTYSGHGTFVPDTSGDEPDGYDEALCPHDIESGNALLDDEIHQLFASRAVGVRIVLISDSCHSGSVIRWAGSDPDSDGNKPRFLPPASWLPEERLPRSADGEIITRVERGTHANPFLGALSAGDLLLAGCQDKEFSYDARFGGRPNGAMTYYALKTLKSFPADISYADWFKAIRKYLPSANYPQTPQILGGRKAKALKALD